MYTPENTPCKLILVGVSEGAVMVLAAVSRY